MIVLRPLGLVLLQKIKCDSWDTEELDLVFYIQKIWIKQLILGLLKGFYGDSSSTIFCLIKLDFLFLKALCPGGSEFENGRDLY